MVSTLLTKPTQCNLFNGNINYTLHTKLIIHSNLLCVNIYINIYNVLIRTDLTPTFTI